MVEVSILGYLELDCVEIWVLLSIPKMEIVARDCRGERLLFSIACLSVRPQVCSICYCADELSASRNRRLDIDRR